MQVSFRKRAAENRVLLRKMTYEGKVLYASSPPCTIAANRRSGLGSVWRGRASVCWAWCKDGARSSMSARNAGSSIKFALETVSILGPFSRNSPWRISFYCVRSCGLWSWFINPPLQSLVDQFFSQIFEWLLSKKKKEIWKEKPPRWRCSKMPRTWEFWEKVRDRATGVGSSRCLMIVTSKLLHSSKSTLCGDLKFLKTEKVPIANQNPWILNHHVPVAWTNLIGEKVSILRTFPRNSSFRIAFYCVHSMGLWSGFINPSLQSIVNQFFL